MSHRTLPALADLAVQHLQHELVPPPFRRLTDKVLIVFHHACDANELDVATYLLRLLEMMAFGSLPPPSGERRVEVLGLVEANERLWRLRNPECN